MCRVDNNKKAQYATVAHVLLPLPLGLYSYRVSCEGNLASDSLPNESSPPNHLLPDHFLPGDLVVVSFRNKEMYAVVWEVERQNIADKNLKSLSFCVQRGFLSDEMRTFIKRVSQYYVIPMGLVLAMVMPGYKGYKEEVKPKRTRKEKKEDVDLLVSTSPLSHAQQEISDHLDVCCGYGVHVLEGVTGSGKTNIYFEKITAILEQGKQVLVLLPEIALLIPLQQRFLKHFGFKPVLWHSSMTPKKRKDTYTTIQKGEARVVLGTRSSLFLPMPKLGLIVVDEEHDSGFKQDEGICYHGRDMAVLRARVFNIPIILASATPSMETIFNVLQKRYTYYCLGERYGPAVLPHVEVVDLIKEPLSKGRFVSEALRLEMEKTLSLGKQSLLFLNRRGYAPLFLCRGCGYRMMCPSCSVWLTGHGMLGHNNVMEDEGGKQSGDPWLRCHYCDYAAPLPSICPECHQEDRFVACGPGVERIAEEVSLLFPEARVEIAVSDILSTPLKVEKFVERVMKQEIDIIVGTQMMAKGYHFPHLSCVGVIDMDAALFGPDFRAIEKGYQMISQIMGRAGREKEQGKVLLQTMYADSPLVKCLVKHDVASLLSMDLEARKREGWAPFSKMVGIVVSSIDKAKAHEEARALVRYLWEVCDYLGSERFLKQLETNMTHIQKKRDKRTKGSLDQVWPWHHALEVKGMSNSLNEIVCKKSMKHTVCAGFNIGFDILGPVEAPLFMLRGEYRYRLIVKVNADSFAALYNPDDQSYVMAHMMNAFMKSLEKFSQIRGHPSRRPQFTKGKKISHSSPHIAIKADLDPISFM